MRRDIGSEVIVAIVAVLVLALALIFGVILSLSNNEGREAAVRYTPTTAATLAESTAAQSPVETMPSGGVTSLPLTLGTSEALPTNDATVSTISQMGTPEPTFTPIFGELFASTVSPAVPSDETDTVQIVTPTPTTAASNTPLPPTATNTSSRTFTVTAAQTSTRTPSATATTTPTFTRTFTPTSTFTSSARPSATNTSSPTNSATATRTATRTPSPTATATGTFTLTSTNTSTARPSATSAISPTSTATATPSRTYTNTTAPTATSTYTATRTNTTAPSNTPRHTNTSVPTNTHTHTLSPTATRTATPIPTNTPSRTPTRTHTNTAAPTATNTATRTNSPTPPRRPSTITPTPNITQTSRAAEATATALIANLPTSQTLPENLAEITPLPVQQYLCTQPPNWTAYEVEDGDTLYAIAQQVGSSVGELRDVNCLATAEALPVGLALYVPRLVQASIPTAVPIFPSGTPAEGALMMNTGLLPDGCNVQTAQIVLPVSGQVVEDIVTLFGAATSDDFAFYRLDVRPESATTFDYYDQFTVPVEQGALGDVNTALFGDGAHWIRLTVVNTDGSTDASCAIPVIFR